MLIKQLEKKIRSLNLNLYGICEYEKGEWEKITLRECNPKNDVYSVSKSVTSLVTGILIGEGVMSLEDHVTDVLGGLADFPPGWEKVTVEHLLTHTTGHAEGCLDIDSADISAWGFLDYIEVVTKQPLVYAPGKKMCYSDSNFYLLSRMITAKSGRMLQDLVRERILIPMEIMGTAWAACPKGYAMGATGLFLGVEDMAKLGVLMLHHGNWKGRQLVPAFWTEEMRKKRIVSRHSAQDYYGYGMWRRSDTDASIISGSRGQRIFVFPDREHVVAWQGYTGSAGLGLLINELLQLEKGSLQG